MRALAATGLTGAAIASILLVPLAGAAGGGPAATLSPATLTFADRAIGTRADAQAVQLTNSGDGPLTISNLHIDGPDAGDFAQGTACPVNPDTLAPGASCTTYVSFTPDSAGAKSATLVIGDDAASSPQTVPLSGGGVAAPQVQLAPTTLAFGGVQVGDHSVAQTVTMTNGGTAPLSLSAVRLAGANAGDFTTTTTCSTSAGLAPGASCTADVVFSPQSVGAKIAALVFDDNAPDAPESVPLSGTANAAPVPSAGLSPTTLGFGSVNVGATSGAQTVTLTDAGGVPLTIDSINASADFAETTDCPLAPVTLAAGASCSVHVSFAPSNVGARVGTLTVSDNAPGNPQQVALSGRGLAPGTYLSDDFESSSLAQWDMLTSSNATVSLDSTVSNSGSTSVRFTNNVNEQSSRLSQDLAGGGHAQSYTRFCFRVAPGSTDGMEIANGRAITAEYPLGIRRWEITYNPVTHGLEGYFFNEALQRLDLYAATGRVLPGDWHCAELYLDESATGHAQLWLDGVSVGRVDGDLSTPSPYSRLFLWNQPANGTVWFDDVRVADSPIGPTGAAAANRPPAQAELGASTMSFGAVNVGSSAGPQTVTLTNDGGSPLTISSLGVTNGGSDFSETTDCPIAPATLAAGASCAAHVSFAPTAVGPRAGSLTVADDATGSPQHVALTGSGLAVGTYLSDDFESGSLAQWSVLSSSGSTAAVDTSTANSGVDSVRLANTGDGQYSRLMADLAGGSHPQSYTRFCFRIAEGATAGVEIANGRAITAQYPDGIRRWEITYNPVTKGLEGSFFNDALQRLDLYAANGKVTPDVWHCAEVYVDERATGHAELWLDGVSVGRVDGDLSTPDPYSRLYLWNQPATGTVWFDDVEVANAPIGPIGAGAANQPPPQATLSPATLGFGSQAMGTTTAETVTLTNTGGSPLAISRIAIADGGADFSQTNDCPATMAAGGSCSIHVTFAPSATGVRTGSLTVTDDAGGSPQAVSLSGAGLASGTYVSDDFESGSLGQWDVLASAGSTVAIDSTVAHTGTSSVRLTNGSDGQYSRMMADLAGGGHSQSYTRFCFQVAPGMAQGTEIANGRAITAQSPGGLPRWEIIYDPGTHGLDGYFFNGALQRLDLYAANGLVLPGSWHCAQLYVDESASGHAELWLDGVSVGRVDGDLSAGDPYSRLYLWNEAPASTIWFDDVAVANAPSG